MNSELSIVRPSDWMGTALSQLRVELSAATANRLALSRMLSLDLRVSNNCVSSSAWYVAGDAVCSINMFNVFSNWRLASISPGRSSN